MNAKPKILLLAILAAVFLAPSYANAEDESSDTRDILITPNDGSMVAGGDFDEPEEIINTKDLRIEQANIYNISPGNSGRRQNHSSHGSRQRTSVSIWVNDRNNTYNIGENIIFYAKAKRDGYLTIIDVGTSGRVHQLFPNRYQPDNYVRRGQTIQIPAKNADFHYTIAGPTGTELVKAFISSNSASIYGKSAKNFDNGVFPGYEADAQTLTKDINVELNQSGRHNDWQTYNKVIYIRDGSGGGGYHGGGRYNPAAQAERDLRLGAAKIREIQMRLRDDGYYRGRLDGTIGPETRRALRDWQRDNGLQISGYIDSETFAALVN